jgi:hypothetical protein
MTPSEAEALDAALGPWWTLPPRQARKAESEALRGRRPERVEPPGHEDHVHRSKSA